MDPQPDNIGSRILQILKEKGIKPTPFEERNSISRGYFKKVADSGTGIGTEIVDKILLEFPDLDARWLITGKPLSINTEEKHTAATKSDEAAVVDVLERTVKILRDENQRLLNIVELALKRGGSDGAE